MNIKQYIDAIKELLQYMKFVYIGVTIMFLFIFINTNMLIYGILAIIASINASKEIILSKLNSMMVDYEESKCST